MVRWQGRWHLQAHTETTASVSKQGSWPALVKVQVAVGVGVDVSWRKCRSTAGKDASVVGLDGGSILFGHFCFFGTEPALMKSFAGAVPGQGVDGEFRNPGVLTKHTANAVQGTIETLTEGPFPQ